MLTFRDQAFLASLRDGAITPASFPGLWRWYKADSYGVLPDMTAVGQTGVSPWIDQTGSGDNAGAALPLAYRNTAAFGGLPWLQFATGFLSFAPGALNDFTVIGVHRKTFSDAWLLNDITSGHQLRRSIFGDNVTLFYNGTGAGQGANAFAAPNAILSLMCKRSGANVSFRENKTDRGTFAYSAAAWTIDEIGAAGGAGGNIDLAELLIYKDVAMSDADVDLLYDAYLKPRWTVLP